MRFANNVENYATALREEFKGKSVLVTGGTGSFGNALIKTILPFEPARIIVFSRDELKQSLMRKKFPQSCMRFFLGNVRDKTRLKQAFSGVDIVVHAAALKQVPALEYNPSEAIKTNIMGAVNIIEAAGDCNVKKLIALSTDKATMPVNLYGATKLCSDKLFVAANRSFGAHSPMFSVVRYGNVFGSRGSIIPILHELKKKGVINLTDPTMTRFNITLPEAVEFVLSNLLIMEGAEIFIPKIPSYKLPVIAKAIAPRCKVNIIGVRPGEKKHEMMVPEDEAYRTFNYGDRYAIFPSWKECTLSPVPPNFSYNSGTNPDWCTISELRSQYKDWCDYHGYECDLCKPEQGPEPAIAGGTPVRETKLPYGRQTIDAIDVANVSACLTDDFLTTGPKVEEFEQLVCQLTNATHGIAVSNGTAALHAACFAAGVGPSDEVIVADITFVASSNAAVYLGATPVFADIRRETLCIDCEHVRTLVTPKTKAIIAVDMCGQPVELDELMNICSENNLVLIEDASHSLGATYKGRMVGSIAHMTTFSFHPVKNITTGEGGMVVTNNETFATACRIFRSHGIETNYKMREKTSRHQYDMASLGFNYRLTDIQCALGISQLYKCRGFIEKRQSIAKAYNKAFKTIAGIHPLHTKEHVTNAHHLYVICLDLDSLKCTRDEFHRAMIAENIGVNVHYAPVHTHSYYKEILKTAQDTCPNASYMYDRILTLPCFPTMKEKDIEDVVLAVQKLVAYFKK